MVNFGFSAPGAQKGTGKSPTAEENACLVFISREKEFYFYTCQIYGVNFVFP